MRRSHWLFGSLLFLPLILSCQARDPIAKPAEALEVYFSPKGGCTDAVVRELSRAKSSVRIQAYSFTSAPIAKAIIDAKKRGVTVEAVLDKSNRTDKYSAATFLKNQGCDVLIDAKHAIAHNKIMIIDDKVILTGSFNFTKNAEENNAENLLVIRDQPKLVEKYLANFRLHQKHSEPYQGLGTSAVTEEKTEDATKGKFVGSKNSDVYH
jgi:phosphatidylserine/phosphatidylglycerophosphate/cardiolipin synthase-like enzyme